jgi:histone H3/H4
MSILPRAPFERILKKAGAKRISDKALKEMAEVVEEKLLQIAEEAVKLARHAGRKTIFPSDIKLAKKRLEKL